MNKKLISWNNYLYIGLLFAVLNTIVEGSSDGYEQLALFALFFVFTGIKENVGLLRRFVCKFPAFAGFALLSTLYFLFLNRNEYLSYRYAGTIFCLVFAGYCISDQGKESVEMAMEKLWAVLMVLLGVAVVNHVMVHDFENRMNLFFLNPIPEGDAAVVLMLISLFFICSKAKRAAGALVACGAVMFSVTRHDLILLVLVVLVYSVINRKEIRVIIRNKPVPIAIAAACVCVGIVVLAKRSDIVTVHYFIRRFRAMLSAVVKDPYLNYYGDAGFGYRVVAVIQAIKVARSGSFLEKMLGRGLMSTFDVIAPATKVLADGGVAGPIENAFISFMADFGVIAFVLYLGTYLSAILKFFTSRESYLKTLSLFVVITMSTTLFADMQYWNNVAYFIWVFSGIWLGGLARKKEKRAILQPFAFSVCVAAVIFILPTLHSWLRTSITAISQNLSAAVIMAFIIVVVAAIIIFAWNICGVGISFAIHKNIDRKSIRGSIIGLSLLSLAVLFGNVQTVMAKDTVNSRIDSEKDMLEAIEAGADGSLYCDTFPSLYDQKIGNIKATLFSGASLAADRDTTVIMSINDEAQRLTDTGFLYLPISEWDVVYTNDQGVIMTLSELGMMPKGYCTKVYEVDGSSVMMGDSIEIYPGEYTATCTLKLSESGKYNEDYSICEISLIKDKDTYTEETVAETTVMRSGFDECGVLSEELKFYAGGADYTFALATESQDAVELDKIEFTRTPDYDRHTITDDNYRVIREEYFDNEGTPININWGYHALEFDYNSDDIWRVIRFLDMDLKPVVLSVGYSEMHRYLDENLRVTKEEYYGVDGKPIAIAGGQAVAEYEYDEAGNRTVERYFGVTGDPVLYYGVYHCVKRTYNDINQIIREEYYDTQQSPMTLAGGQGSVEYEYDENGNRIIERFYDADGKPVLYNGEYWYLVRTYNDSGQDILEEYYDLNGDLVEVR